MSKKLKNWEELVNDGEQYGDPTSELTQEQKIIFENIKDQKVLKLQDAYDFVKKGGGIGSKSSHHFREFILEVGGSLDFMQQYIKFRGCKPKIEGLLKASGITVNHS